MKNASAAPARLRGVAPRAAKPSLEHYADYGELIVTQLTSAPFPHPKRAEGHKYQGKVYSAKEHYSDNTVAIFIPKGLPRDGPG